MMRSSVAKASTNLIESNSRFPLLRTGGGVVVDIGTGDGRYVFRSTRSNPDRFYIMKPVDDRPVWSIVCFFVDRGARGRGLSRRMLRAAVDYARTHGARLLEAYPVDSDRLGAKRIPQLIKAVGATRSPPYRGLGISWGRSVKVALGRTPGGIR
jgi:GNAT superfamily N-acetyltransferase